jgi:hypothetical protein
LKILTNKDYKEWGDIYERNSDERDKNIRNKCHAPEVGDKSEIAERDNVFIAFETSNVPLRIAIVNSRLMNSKNLSKRKCILRVIIV